MSMDLNEFHDMFFEESLEALDDMESCLLNLDIGTPDVDAVNTIFRGAHSVKGGSGMFGFTEITGFTHVLETLLDQIREGGRPVTQSLVDVMLQAVDCLREMLRATQAGEALDLPRVTALQGELESLLAGGQPRADMSAAAPAAPRETPRAGGEPRWRISFRPHANMLASANDPIRILHELGRLGRVTTTADLARLPAFEALRPEQCYLAWELELESAASREEIADLFEWVEFECELEIVALDEAVAETGAQPVATPDAPSASSPSPAPAAAGNPALPGEAPRKDGARQGPADPGSIRVGIDKVDNVINLVGELVITQSMLQRFGEEGAVFDNEELREGLNELERNTRELQQTVMQIRMLPISFSFNRFPRLVRDISGKMGKQIELVIKGEQTELDKTVLEKIGDPLVHLVRNSLDHGIETPEERRAAGKAETGVLTLNAYHAGGNIVIEVRDDGRGLPREKILAKARSRGLVDEDEELSDEQVHNLIFSAGFSTAENVSEISGRGVGMDVVKRNITDLGGSVDVQSEEGKGCTFTVRLPLTLAILDGQLVTVGNDIYVISLVSIIESIQVRAEQIHGIAGGCELYRVRGEYLPIVRLNRCFGLASGTEELTEGLLVVVESDGTRVGLFIDDLLGQQQVVIKSLETNFRQVEGLSGATILGDGTVALIIDVPGLIKRAHAENIAPALSAARVA